MIEEEPVDSTANAEMVDDPARAQSSGDWALPEAGTITVCPKCGSGNRSEDGDDGRFQVRYHLSQWAFDPTRGNDAQFRENPCAFTDIDIFPTRRPWGLGGEHLCVTCLRCHFGWAEKVADPTPVYRQREEGEG